MKMLLVKFNRPVLINESRCEQSKIQPLYGFFVPESWIDEEDVEGLDDKILIYLGYLSALQEWSTYGDVEFTVLNDEIWMDIDGTPHCIYGQWAIDIGQKCREKLGLDFARYEVDLNEIDGVCFDCGQDQSFITCGTLMESLVRLAEQNEPLIKTAANVNHESGCPK